MKKVIITIVSIFLLLAALNAGIRIYFAIKISQREALSHEVSLNGPWKEPAVWESADGQAYLLAEKESDEEFAEVTAYFYFNGAWHSFQMDGTPGNTLCFSVIDEETGAGESNFTATLDFEDGVFMVKNLTAFNENKNIPPCDAYVFSKAANYDEAISRLPFDV